ncbi:MAG: hypothetical protein FRX49_08093 [Trebouxia sp. A1-2]|nr:MAG: hypothetical protein FRX49_08093 [Trebouxia sp. A1-2]
MFTSATAASIGFSSSLQARYSGTGRPFLRAALVDAEVEAVAEVRREWCSAKALLMAASPTMGSGQAEFQGSRQGRFKVPNQGEVSWFAAYGLGSRRMPCHSAEMDSSGESTDNDLGSNIH